MKSWRPWAGDRITRVCLLYITSISSSGGGGTGQDRLIREVVGEVRPRCSCCRAYSHFVTVHCSFVSAQLRQPHPWRSGSLRRCNRAVLSSHNQDSTRLLETPDDAQHRRLPPLLRRIAVPKSCAAAAHGRGLLSAACRYLRKNVAEDY